MKSHFSTRSVCFWSVVADVIVAFQLASSWPVFLSGSALADPSTKGHIISSAKLELSEMAPHDHSIRTLQLRLLIGRLEEDKVVLDHTLQSLSKLDDSNPHVALMKIAVRGQRALLDGRFSALTKLPGLEADLMAIAKRFPQLPGGSPYLALARLYDLAPPWISIGSHSNAELNYRKALMIAPKRLATRIYYADFLRRSGRHKESREVVADVDLENLVQEEFADLPELLECLADLNWNVPKISTMLTSLTLKKYLKLM